MTDRDLLEADLASFMAADEPPPEAYDGPPEPPEGAEQADRMLRRLRRLRDEEEQVQDLYNAELDRLNAWRLDRLSGVVRARAWLARSLEGFMRRHGPERGVRTLSLPNGHLTLRAASPRVVVTDLDAFRDWVEANDPDNLLGYVRVTVEPSKEALRKLEVDEAGVVPTADGERAWPLVVSWESEDHPGEPERQTVPGVALVKAAEDTFGWSAS